MSQIHLCELKMISTNKERQWIKEFEFRPANMNRLIPFCNIDLELRAMEAEETEFACVPHARRYLTPLFQAPSTKRGLKALVCKNLEKAQRCDWILCLVSSLSFVRVPLVREVSHDR